MRLATLAILAALFSFSGCASFNAPPSLAPLEAKAGDYKLDPHHTAVLWKVDHLGGLSKFVGRFDDVSGIMQFDPAAPQTAKIDIRIQANSVSTSVKGFSETIAKKIFDAKDHPEIRFVSTSIDNLTSAGGVAHGELTMRGVTHPEDIQIQYNGSKINPLDGKETLGFAAQSVIRRSDYGATAWKMFGVGDKINLEIHTEFVKAEGAAAESPSNQPN